MSYSVVIPAFNAALTIEEAIRSVLRQSAPPRAVIVVDDGSSDETAATVDRMAGPIRLLRQANAGPGAATTAGFAAVTTEFLATLDADDLWLPGKAERQLHSLMQDTRHAAVFGYLAEFGGDPETADRSRAYPGWSRTTLFMRTSTALANGPIVDPPGRAGEMIDWLARLREAGNELLMLEDVVALRRIRAGSLTHGRPATLGPSYLNVVRAAILRRRSRGLASHE